MGCQVGRHLCFSNPTLVARLRRAYPRTFWSFVKDASSQVERTAKCTAGGRVERLRHDNVSTHGGERVANLQPTTTVMSDTPHR